MSSPNLALTSLAAAQAQKHVTVNEALARIDAATQLAVLTRTLSDPPANPDDGARYIVASGGAAEWQGHDGAIAAWDAAAEGWLMLTPRPGWRVWIIDEDALFVRRADAWFPVQSGTNPVPDGLLGVNATADPINRLAVSSPAILFNHAGAGIHAKLNKASTTDTGAFLFQTDFSGRAEFGLTGSDDLTLKTSPDGTTFTDAMRVPAADARPDFPQGVTLSGSTPFLHYEEGDFPLEINLGSIASGDWATATGLDIRSARYTRIGNLVTIRAVFSFEGVASSDITAPSVQTLKGLPFDPADASALQARDHHGFATLVGSIPPAHSVNAQVIILASGAMFLSFKPLNTNRVHADGLIILTATYEAT